MSDDLRAAFTRLVDEGPPAPSGAAAVLAGRRHRRRRTLTAVTAAAAAVLAVLAIALTPGLRPIAAPPASTPTPVEHVDPSETADPLPIPGLTPAQVRSLAYDCAKAVTEGPDPRHPSLRDMVRTLRVFNHTRDELGSLTMLYGPGGDGTCEVTADGGGEMIAGYGSASPTWDDWLTGGVSMDRQTGALQGSDHGHDSMTITGRVAHGAATVTVDFPAGHRTVPVVNDTYLFRWVGANGVLGDNTSLGATVTARDAAGQVLGRTSTVEGGSCYRLDGHRVQPGMRSSEGGTCPDAVRWEPSRAWNPGTTPALLSGPDTAAVLAGCAAAAGGVDAGDLRLRNTFDDISVAGALLGSPDGLVYCEYTGLSGPYAARARAYAPADPDPVTIDYADSSGSRDVVLGRTSPEVARVEAKLGIVSHRAELHDGTFLIGAANDGDRSDPADFVVTAYDKDGHRLN